MTDYQDAHIEFRGPVPYIGAKDGPAQARFYEKAFGAKIVSEAMAEDGKRYMNACLEIAGGHIMMSDAFPEWGKPFEPPAGLHVFLWSQAPQADFDRAVGAGCTVEMPMEVQFWGDRYGQVRDPYGVLWAIGGKP